MGYSTNREPTEALPFGTPRPEPKKDPMLEQIDDPEFKIDTVKKEIVSASPQHLQDAQH